MYYRGEEVSRVEIMRNIFATGVIVNCVAVVSIELQR